MNEKEIIDEMYNMVIENLKKDPNIRLIAATIKHALENTKPSS